MKRLLIGCAFFIALSATAAVFYSLGTYENDAVGARAEVSKPDIYGLREASNKERIKVGLPALVLDPKLNQSAQDKCDDMVKLDYFEHDRPDGTEPWVFIEKYAEYMTAGENISYGYPTSQAVTNGWMNSPTHKDNILHADYENVGYAVCYSKDGIYDYGAGYVVVQHFIAE